MREPWYFLRIEVTPETVKAYFRCENESSWHLVGVENQPRNRIDPIQTKILAMSAKWRGRDLDRDKKHKDLPRRIDYEPLGAFGLIVTGAVVDFRNVTYEQLRDDVNLP